MKQYVVSVFDSAMQAFARPIFVPALGVAIRSFADEVNRQAPDNQMHQHPDDFELFELGTFDEETGQFTNLENVRSLGRGKDVKQS